MTDKVKQKPREATAGTEVKISKDAQPDERFRRSPEDFRNKRDMFGATSPLHAQAHSHQSKKFIVTSRHALMKIVHDACMTL